MSHPGPPAACAPSDGRGRGFLHFTRSLPGLAGDVSSHLREKGNVGAKSPTGRCSPLFQSFLFWLGYSFFQINLSAQTQKVMKLIVGFNLPTGLLFAFLFSQQCVRAHMHAHRWGVSRVHLEPRGAMHSYSTPSPTSPGTPCPPQWNSAP